MDIRETGDFTADIQRHFWETARLEFVKKLICISGKIPQTIIDIGCGDAFVLQSLAQYLPETAFTGIDTALTDEMICRINQRAVNCKNISLYRKMPERKEQNIDMILLLDVLEHIENEEDFLRSLHNVMHSGSKIIITVPAFQKLFTDHDRFLKHFRRYNRKSLLNVLENSGFQVSYSGYIFCSLLPFRVMQKLLRIKSSGRDNLRAGNKFLNRIAGIILKIDAAVTFYLSCRKIYIPGLSCFAVAALKSRADYHPSFSGRSPSV